MATLRRTAPPQQHWTVRFLPLQTLKNAQDLVQRYREVEGIRLYLQERFGLVLLATLGIALISFACAVGVLVFLGNRHSLLALLGILLMPVVLAGSFTVMAYVFFSWIEGRALAKQLANRHRQPAGAAALWLKRKTGLDMGPAPSIPWLLAVPLLFVPLVLLTAAWLSVGLTIVLLGVLMPFAYAKFET